MANELLARLDPTTGRLAPGGVAVHDDLDGLTHHAPSALGQDAGLMPQTNGDGTYELVPTPALDPTEAAGRTLGVSQVAPETSVDWTPNTQTGEYDATTAVTFAAPNSGRVIVEVNATWTGSASAAQLKEGSSVAASCSVDPSSAGARRHLVFVVSDLTPGSHTFALGASVGSGLTLRAGPTTPVTITVKDAPF